MTTSIDRYRDDLAYIHDVGFGGFARSAAPGLLAMLHQSGFDRGLVVDLGCGSGLWARALVDAGYEVLGIDLSAAMIAIARQRVPEARFLTGSYLDAPIPRCGAVTAIGECFNFTFDPRKSASRLRRFFRRVRGALRPGGLFVLDVAGPGRGRASGPPRRHWSGDDWAILLEAEEDPARHQLVRRMTTLRKVGDLYRRDKELHRLRLYEKSEVASWLRQAGFRVRVLRGYGSFRFPVGLAGFSARLP